VETAGKVLLICALVLAIVGLGALALRGHHESALLGSYVKNANY
jgi:hypothetical protein